MHGSQRARASDCRAMPSRIPGPPSPARRVPISSGAAGGRCALRIAYSGGGHDVRHERCDRHEHQADAGDALMPRSRARAATVALSGDVDARSPALSGRASNMLLSSAPYSCTPGVRIETQQPRRRASFSCESQPPETDRRNAPHVLELFVERGRPACGQFVRALSAIAVDRRDQLLLHQPRDRVVEGPRSNRHAGE